MTFAGHLHPATVTAKRTAASLNPAMKSSDTIRPHNHGAAVTTGQGIGPYACTPRNINSTGIPDIRIIPLPAAAHQNLAAATIARCIHNSSGPNHNPVRSQLNAAASLPTTTLGADTAAQHQLPPRRQFNFSTSDAIGHHLATVVYIRRPQAHPATGTVSPNCGDNPGGVNDPGEHLTHSASAKSHLPSLHAATMIHNSAFRHPVSDKPEQPIPGKVHRHPLAASQANPASPGPDAAAAANIAPNQADTARRVNVTSVADIAHSPGSVQNVPALHEVPALHPQSSRHQVANRNPSRPAEYHAVGVQQPDAATGSQPPPYLAGANIMNAIENRVGTAPLLKMDMLTSGNIEAVPVHHKLGTILDHSGLAAITPYAASASDYAAALGSGQY